MLQSRGSGGRAPRRCDTSPTLHTFCSFSVPRVVRAPRALSPGLWRACISSLRESATAARRSLGHGTALALEQAVAFSTSRGTFKTWWHLSLSDHWSPALPARRAVSGGRGNLLNPPDARTSLRRQRSARSLRHAPTRAAGGSRSGGPGHVFPGDVAPSGHRWRPGNLPFFPAPCSPFDTRHKQPFRLARPRQIAWQLP